MLVIKDLCKRIIYGKIPSSYIFMFHHLQSYPSIKLSNCTLNQYIFSSILENIFSFDVCATLEETVKYPHRRKIAITFDDGLEDVYNIAYPLCNKFKLPFTVFIVPDFVDKEGYMKTEQIVELSANPLVHIGSHGMSHKILKNLPEADITYEVVRSRHVLEDITGKTVDLFAYSHGLFDYRVFNIVASNYKYAFGTKPRPCNILTTINKYDVPRFNIDDSCILERSEFINSYSKGILNIPNKYR